MKDLCDETWNELYGAEYGMSDKRPCEPMYSFFCNGWNRCEEKLKCCENCFHNYDADVVIVSNYCDDCTNYDKWETKL